MGGATSAAWFGTRRRMTLSSAKRRDSMVLPFFTQVLVVRWGGSKIPAFSDAMRKKSITHKIDPARPPAPGLPHESQSISTILLRDE